MSIPIRSRNTRSNGTPAASGTYETYSSGQPSRSFLGSGNFRSNYGYDIPPPKASLYGYNTAKSSFASYATAPSVPQFASRMGNISEASETPPKEVPFVGWLGILAITVKNRDECVRPHEDFEPLIDRVVMHVRDDIGDPKLRVDLLRRVVKSHLWDLCPCESISEVKANAETDNSDATDEDIERERDDEDWETDKEDEVEEEAASIAAAEEADEDEDEDEPDTEPLDKLMGQLELMSYQIMGIATWPICDPEHKATLMKQLQGYISEYLAGRAKDSDHTHDPVFSSEWLRHLHERGILLKPRDELDWSGRGQHVEYEAPDEADIPLQTKKVLGYSATAIVESVQCRRILLARKTVKCNRRLTKENVVMEVQHLQRLQHSHIIKTWKSSWTHLWIWSQKIRGHGFYILPEFLGCLSNAISFIHLNNVKHMDIKPKNILVRQRKDQYKVYIADFGIAKAYESAAEASTDSPTSFTRTYAAPEVILQDIRGYSADIFSLGCVFLEIIAAMRSTPTLDEREHLTRIRGNDYQSNIESILAWYESCAHVLQYSQTRENVIFKDELQDLMARTLSRQPEERPTADDLKRATKYLRCKECDTGSEAFVATTT